MVYCSQCGASAQDNFCSNCGAAIQGCHGSVQNAPQFSVDEVRYDLLLQSPDVRQTIADCAEQAKRPISGEQFLELCDIAFSPVAGVSLLKIASVAQPLYARLGIRTGKTRAVLVSAPAGPVLVGVLCSLALHGHTVRRSQQAADGCLLEAAIPSDIWSFEGDLLVTVQRHQEGTLVEAATIIKGQLFDWGKSQRCLDSLFADLVEVVSGWCDEADAA
ncbi:MAG: zinc ribbon domain-containing protein [Planctomycetes bacterium]|nr:zinc ribbon domain-containing protein [Planctomycetota bacterium]